MGADEAGDILVADALAALAREDSSLAAAADHAFQTLTAGMGLDVVTLHGLQDWLWYQLPAKHLGGLDDHLQAAAALGALFTRLEMPRYAAVCGSATTQEVITTWQHGRSRGLAAMEQAMRASGVHPLDVEDVIVWGEFLGVEEAGAFNGVAAHLELAIAAGDFTPGAHGWRQAAQRTTAGFLTTARPELDGQTLLDRIHTERLDTWQHRRGASIQQLIDQVAPLLAVPASAPDDAEERLAPVRWLLTQAQDDGVPLTANHTFTRPTLADGAKRFDWLTLGKAPRSESDVVEIWTLRELLRELGAVRRQGRRLLLTPAGRKLATAPTAQLWATVTTKLMPKAEAEAAAAEVTLLLYLTGAELGYYDQCDTVATAMAEQGWQLADDTPITGDQTGRLIGALSRRLHLLGLLAEYRPPGVPSDRLTPAGRTAAHAVLRAHALRPRTNHHSG